MNVIESKKFTFFFIFLFLFVFPCLEALAATKYVRPVSGGPYGQANGTSYKDAFAGFAKVLINSGDTLIVCGTFTSADAEKSWVLYDIAESGSATNPTIIDGDCSSQGDLPRAALNANGMQFGVYILGPASHINIRNLEIYGVDTSTGSNRFLFRLCTITEGSSCKNITVSNLLLHDAIDPGGANEANGIWGICDECIIEKNEIYNISSDGIWLGSAKGTVIRDNHIHHVATNGRVTGDCVQLSNADNLYMHDNVLDHSNTDAKQALMIHSGTGIRVAKNKMMMSNARDQTDGVSKTLNIEAPGAIVEGNYITGGWAGLWVVGGGTQVRNNIISGAYGYQVAIGDGSTYDFYNNVVDCKDLSNAIGFNNSGTGYTRSVKNNIFTRCSVAIQKGGTGTLNFDNNLLYQNLKDTLWFTMSGTNLVADPMFSNQNGTYSSPADYSLKVGSPAINAGANIGLSVDYLEKPRDSQPDIGAFEYSDSQTVIPSIKNLIIQD
jgi:hypothetical protein